MPSRPLQYRLAGLLALLTLASLILGYVRFVGVWGFVVALGPPIVIAGIFNAMISPPGWTALRPRQEPDWEKVAPSAIRVLLSLVFGFLMWLPILLVLKLR